MANPLINDAAIRRALRARRRLEMERQQREAADREMRDEVLGGDNEEGDAPDNRGDDDLLPIPLVRPLQVDERDLAVWKEMENCHLNEWGQKRDRQREHELGDHRQDI